DGIDDRKDGGIGANAEGERENRNRGEGRGAPQGSDRVAEVLSQIVHEILPLPGAGTSLVVRAQRGVDAHVISEACVSGAEGGVVGQAARFVLPRAHVYV